MAIDKHERASILERMSKRKRQEEQNREEVQSEEKRKEVTLQAGNHAILPSKQERLLGCMVSDNLKWRDHILVGDQAVVKQLRSRVNALSMLSTRGDFNTKLMTANGIVISKA